MEKRVTLRLKTNRLRRNKKLIYVSKPIDYKKEKRATLHFNTNTLIRREESLYVSKPTTTLLCSKKVITNRILI